MNWLDFEPMDLSTDMMDMNANTFDPMTAVDVAGSAATL
jgi:hypothetical protein